MKISFIFPNLISISLVMGFLLARIGKDDDGPVVVFISERLNQVHQIGVLHLFWGEDVPLVQFLHCPSSIGSNKINVKVPCSKVNFFIRPKPDIYKKMSSA